MISSKINFSIDGLEDTNHIYRRNVSWKKVWSNLNSFVESGGRGSWTYIVFKHNEHQVQEARNTATGLGLEFRLKITQKFRGYQNWSVMENGQKLYELSPPDNAIYRHSNVGLNYHHPQNDYFDFPSIDTVWPELDQAVIECQSKKKNELFLSHAGHLLPCCFLGTTEHDSPGAAQFRQSFDIELVNLNKISAETAITNLKRIENSWTAKSIREGKLVTCARTCGKKMRNTVEYIK